MTMAPATEQTIAEREISLSYWKQQAYYAQDACNLGAVLRSFTRWIDYARTAMTWDAADAHTVTILFASKVQSMSNGSIEE